MEAPGRRIGWRALLLLLATGLSTGVHWDMAQVGAWARMTLQYAEAMPVGQALQLALDPANTCGVCRVIDGARDSEDRSPPPLIERQVDKQVSDARIVVARRPVPRAICRSPERRDRVLHPGNAPPVPPPRLG